MAYQLELIMLLELYSTLDGWGIQLQKKPL